MSDLRLDFEWEDPLGARGAELRATWARLRIDFDGQPVTRVLDHVTKSVRESVYLPLYPLAEWIATHWWFLFAEIETPGKGSSLDFARRHNLRFAQEGFSLPDLTLRPTGTQVHVAWSPTLRGHQHLEFISRGSGYVAIATLRRSLSDFLTAVLGRLHEMGIHDTLLEQDWAAISDADPDEAAFCGAAASLGLDPYALAEEQAESILAIAARLPPSLATEFFPVATPQGLGTQADSVLDSLEAAQANNADLSGLAVLRETIGGMAGRQRTPWQQGYQFARELRHHLGLNGQTIADFANLGDALGVRSRDLLASMVQAEPPAGIDAVVGIGARSNPGFAIAARSEEAKRFAYCRGLFEYLTSRNLQPSLVTRAHSERQQRNRAFAAEFLAPAEALRQRISTDVVAEEVIDDLAAEFHVSPLVIRHQLENHGIARSEVV